MPEEKKGKKNKNQGNLQWGESEITRRDTETKPAQINSSGEEMAVRRRPVLEVTPNRVDQPALCPPVPQIPAGRHLRPPRVPVTGTLAFSRQLEQKAKPSVLV